MRRQIARHRRKINAASKLYANFRGEKPRYIQSVDFEVSPVMLLIGELDGVLYSTRRDGKNESYIHKFAKKSRPLLVSNHDGSQIYILGGEYIFSESGIIDR